MATSSALGRLRVLMGGIQPPLTAYIVSTNDRHQSEYLADCDQRRAFISGFTGSAGVALVTVDGAFLWTDGRYHIQASRQLDHNWQLMRQGLPNVPTLTEWMKKQLKSGASVGYDPSLVSEELYNQWKEPLTSNGIRLVPVEENLIDKIWEDRPPPSDAPIFVHPLKYAGESWQSKVNRIRKKMTGENCSVLVCTALDEVAWLYNLRGSDVECNPVFFSYAILTMNDARLFVNSEQLTSEAHSQLVDCQIFPYSDVGRHMVDLIKTTEGKIWINSSSSHELCTLVPRARRIKKHNPIQLMKGIKNDAEIEGMRQAHIKCAVALCEYYSWLEEQLSQGKEVTELQGSEQLEIYRKEQPDYINPSFPTISSSGPNGAINHYRPTPETDRPITLNDLYLCDAGCQFRDGTTDVTRTIHFGIPTDKQKECFTLVLKGHIALCTSVFPEKTSGSYLDSIARMPLWKAGLNYRHGTGHGVGAFLNVHEGPHGIGPRTYKEPLYANMLVSDEPGYYEDGEFGIRIENIVRIKQATTKYKFGALPYLTMEPLTLLPIQLKMIEPTLLDEGDIQWLNEYHVTCRDVIGPVLSEQGRTRAHAWLMRETQLLG